MKIFRQLYHLLNKDNYSVTQDPKSKLLNNSPKTPGEIEIYGWKIRYIDNLALNSSLEVLVEKGWNDFQTENISPVILDCGANIGISILNYKEKHPNSKIIAFEPDPEIILFLKENIKSNLLSGVEIIEAAVWVKNSELDFYMEGADGSRLVHEASEKTVKVKTIDLADYLDQPIDLLKIDIEGAEFEVISHLKNNLNSVKNIIVECHVYADQVRKFGSLLVDLANAGFIVNINSVGQWRDLIRNPKKLQHEFDQYFIVTGYRR